MAPAAVVMGHSLGTMVAEVLAGSLAVAGEERSPGREGCRTLGVGLLADPLFGVL
jgi:hypothetical protein